MKDKILQDDVAIMPLQPLKSDKFISNSIVEKLLEVSPISLEDITWMNFTDQERMQFAQLLGCSASDFLKLEYVDDETYNAVISLSGRNNNELLG